MDARDRVGNRVGRCESRSSAWTSGATGNSSPICPSASAACPASGASASSGVRRGPIDASLILTSASSAAKAGRNRATRRSRPAARPPRRRRACRALRSRETARWCPDRSARRRARTPPTDCVAIEGERRLQTEIGIGIGEQADERARQVDAGQRQELQRAAQQAEIVMPVAQPSRSRRRGRRRAATLSAAHGGAADLPVFVAERGAERADTIRRLEPRQPLDCAPAAPPDRPWRSSRASALPLEARRDVLDGDDQADRALLVAQRAERRRAAACDRMSADGSSGGHGNEEPVQRRRQHSARRRRPAARAADCARPRLPRSGTRSSRRRPARAIGRGCRSSARARRPSS